jgi:hypothetical protein
MGLTPDRGRIPQWAVVSIDGGMLRDLSDDKAAIAHALGER